MFSQSDDDESYYVSVGPRSAQRDKSTLAQRSKPAQRVTAAQRKRSDDFWAHDHSEQHLAQEAEAAAAAIFRFSGREPLRLVLRDNRPHLVSALEPRRASAARRRWVAEAQGLHRRFRRRHREAGGQTYRFWVVLIIARLIVAEADLQQVDIANAKRTVQRLARGLCGETLTTGVIELALNEDPQATPRKGWVPHANLIVEVVARSRGEARRRVEAAFRLPADENKGVYTPVKAMEVYWLLGALRYASKSMQMGAVMRRWGERNEESRRTGTRKLPLRSAERAIYAGFLESIDVEDFVINVGRRPKAYKPSAPKAYMPSIRKR